MGKDGSYQLVAELTGGEETASSVTFLEVAFQTPSGTKVILFEGASANEDGRVLAENEELKDLFIAIADIHNYTAQATAQENQGQTHGPDMLTCSCVGACGDPTTVDAARSTCILTRENTTAPMAMAHMEHAAFASARNMTHVSIDVTPLHLGDACEPTAADTKNKMESGQQCPPGTRCMPKARHSVSDIERYTCQLPLMQKSAVHRVSALYQQKSRNTAFITFFYVCGSVAVLFLLTLAITVFLISRKQYKRLEDGQDGSDEEFV